MGYPGYAADLLVRLVKTPVSKGIDVN